MRAIELGRECQAGHQHGSALLHVHLAARQHARPARCARRRPPCDEEGGGTVTRRTRSCRRGPAVRRRTTVDQGRGVETGACRGSKQRRGGGRTDGQRRFEMPGGRDRRSAASPTAICSCQPSTRPPVFSRTSSTPPTHSNIRYATPTTSSNIRYATPTPRRVRRSMIAMGSPGRRLREYCHVGATVAWPGVRPASHISATGTHRSFAPLQATPLRRVRKSGFSVPATPTAPRSLCPLPTLCWPASLAPRTNDDDASSQAWHAAQHLGVDV